MMKSRARGSAGFTFVEVVVTIALLSIATGGLFTGAYLGMRQLERSRERMKRSTELVELEYYFRSTVSGVFFAYWEQPPSVAENGETYDIRGNDSEAAAIFSVSLDGSAVVITNQGKKLVFRVGATSLSLESFPHDDPAPRGLELIIGIDDRKITIREAYGSASL